MASPNSPGVLSKALNAAWIRPFIFLIFIIIAWDLAIRLFHIPPYQIPAPIDVVKQLWQDWPELLEQTWPTTYATLGGFLLSAAFGIPIAMLIADRGPSRATSIRCWCSRSRYRRWRSRRCSWSGSASASYPR